MRGRTAARIGRRRIGWRGGAARRLPRRRPSSRRRSGWRICRPPPRRSGPGDCRISRLARWWPARWPIPRPSRPCLGTAAEDSLRELRNESRRAQAVDDEEGRQRTHSRAAPLADGCRHRRHLPLVVHRHRRGGRRDRGGVAAVHRPSVQSRPRKKVESRTMAPIRPTGSSPWPTPPLGVTAKPPARSNVKVIVVVDAAALRRGDVRTR